MLLLLIISIILFVIPTILYFFFSYKLNMNIQFVTYFLIITILLMLVTLFAQFYYYLTYDYSVFPSYEFMEPFLLGLFIFVIGYVIFKVITRWIKKYLLKKDDGEPFLKLAIFITIFAVVFLCWFVPLAQKYYSIKRVKAAEQYFQQIDDEATRNDNEVSITLIESGRDKVLRPRRSSTSKSYNNYFYLKNHTNTSVTGVVHIIVFNKDGHIIELKESPVFELDAQEIHLLVFDEQKVNIMNDIWNQYSFSTKEKIVDFDYEIIIQK